MRNEPAEAPGGSLGCLGGPSPRRPLVRSEAVMGTVASVHLYPGPLPVEEAEHLLEATLALLRWADDTFSTWKADSPLSRLRSGELPASEAPTEIAEVAALCERARALTSGWFDPWALPGGFDPTGLVKGWAAARALGLLARAGVEGAMVNAGGDVAIYGSPGAGRRWRIGIAHPWRRGALACVVETEQCVATSGCYERGPHLVDPTGRAAFAGAASATVTGPDLALADALSTALAVAGEELLDLLGSLDGYEAYLVLGDGSEISTEGIVLTGPD